MCFNTKHKILYFLEILSLIFPNILGILLELKGGSLGHLKSFYKGVFAMAKITLFSKNNCMQCKMTKKFLEKEGADFEEINIDEQPEKSIT